MKYIATISGGKDSVTMCDLLLKNGYPVDEIIFTDTLEEFEEMYIYLEKVKQYFLIRYKKEITILKPNSTFNDWCFGIIEKNGAKRIGQVRGIPTKDGMCYWRRESKVYPIERYLKEKYRDEEITFYIGYTKGENRSVKETDTFKYSYPLQDIFQMTEEDCKAYLINQDMENPLYKHFSRTGCAICPFQSDKSWFNIWKHYPKVWNKMKETEMYLDLLTHQHLEVVNKYWFVGHKTIMEKEKEFEFKDRQGSLFDFSDEPVKDCFCKI
jgi:3'-phosphoadenosine 5'-phosphosulfate sulfotransferase (PAPS reductase)/FAD synthetase